MSADCRLAPCLPPCRRLADGSGRRPPWRAAASRLALPLATAALAGCAPADAVRQAAAAPAPACAAAPAPLLERQRAMAAEINLARTEPSRYALIVEQHFATLDRDGVYRSGGQLIRSNEGRAAVDEAVAFLRRTPALPALPLNACLSAASQDHADDQHRGRARGHTGSDGSQPSDRASRHLGRRAYCGENISYGRPSARDHVIALIVDDGVPSRGHRRNLFHPPYRSLGIGVGPHPEHGDIAVSLMCLDALPRD